MRAIDTHRLGDILKLIDFLSQGNFNYHITRTLEEDHIEGIVIGLNMMAEEMFETLSYYSSLQVVDGKRSQLQILFILNQNFKIQYVTESVYEQLGFEAQSLLGVSFSTLIAKSQLPLWRSIGRELLLTKEFIQDRSFLLLTKEGMERSFPCCVISIFDVETNSHNIQVMVHKQVQLSKILDDLPKSCIFISQEDVVEEPGTTYVIRSQTDVNKFREIYHHISQTLDQPLSSLKKLAHDHGLNEYKLKTGFKHMYGDTVFGLQRRLRLENAHLLLTATDFTLKEIAKRCGFISMSHFIRRFRIHYGTTPKAFRDQKFKKRPPK